jgi:hypothetical protein
LNAVSGSVREVGERLQIELDVGNGTIGEHDAAV